MLIVLLLWYTAAAAPIANLHERMQRLFVAGVHRWWGWDLGELASMAGGGGARRVISSAWLESNRAVSCKLSCQNATQHVNKPAATPHQLLHQTHTCLR